MGSALCNMVTGPPREGWSRKGSLRKRHYFVGAPAEWYYGFHSLCRNYESGDPRLSKTGGALEERCRECERRRARRARLAV
jgi:hypothetical protein